MAYSNFFLGVGIAAGGPFMCAKEYDVVNCSTPGNIDLINERSLAMDAF